MNEKRRKNRIKSSSNKSNRSCSLFLKTKECEPTFPNVFPCVPFPHDEVSCLPPSLPVRECGVARLRGGAREGERMRGKKRERVSKQKNRKQRRRNMKPAMTLKQSIPSLPLSPSPSFPLFSPFKSPDPSQAAGVETDRFVSVS